MEGIEKLRWAKALIEEETGGKQRLLAGWDGMPAVQIADGCMVGLYFVGIFVGILTALIMRRFRFKGEAVPFVMELPNYRMRTCGGYSPSARLKELTEECARIAALVAQLEAADIHGDEEAVAAFCEELKREKEADGNGEGGG